ncbi:LolA family protein [Aquisphaera insulae]|uniref:LolA family protein n=1 Tax=Aquisphaera insulae TaxID=2712864 RepID=UPI0013ED627D|nr:outer membrane lipoprotein carrier protein LolA [Aquisphaera insulae]
MRPDADPTSGRPGDDRDRLARAVDALRAEPVPDGPAPAVLARVLEAVEAAAGSTSTPIPLRTRRNAMFITLKVAAAAVLAAGGLFLAGSPFLAGAPISYREVAEKIRDARTLSYTTTSELPDTPKMPPTRLSFKQPGHFRVEVVGTPALVIISDYEAGKRMFLDPAKKTALMLEGRLPGEPKPGQVDLTAQGLAEFRRLGSAEGEALGEKKIGDVTAKGFRIAEKPGYETIVWVDPKTRLPIQVDQSVPFAGKTSRVTTTDIRLDPPLDDELFRLDPPPGYEVIKQNLAAGTEKDDGTPEAALISMLRGYATASNGAFPKKIDDWQDYGKVLAKKTAGPKDAKDTGMAEAIRVATLAGRASVYIAMLDGQYGYKPDGVKLGDADKLLFWCKPKGKETWRGIYGDLHAVDLPADKVPAR